MQKYRLLSLPTILATILFCQFATAQDKDKDWKLVWNDEFDGPDASTTFPREVLIDYLRVHQW